MGATFERAIDILARNWLVMAFTAVILAVVAGFAAAATAAVTSWLLPGAAGTLLVVAAMAIVLTLQLVALATTALGRDHLADQSATWETGHHTVAGMHAAPITILLEGIGLRRLGVVWLPREIALTFVLLFAALATGAALSETGVAALATFAAATGSWAIACALQPAPRGRVAGNAVATVALAGIAAGTLGVLVLVPLLGQLLAWSTTVVFLTCLVVAATEAVPMPESQAGPTEAATAAVASGTLRLRPDGSQATDGAWIEVPVAGLLTTRVALDPPGGGPVTLRSATADGTWGEPQLAEHGAQLAFPVAAGHTWLDVGASATVVVELSWSLGAAGAAA